MEFKCKYDMKSPEYIEACKDFINLVGSKKLINKEKLPAYQLANWRKIGIPLGWSKYFAVVYPESWEKVFVE